MVLLSLTPSADVLAGDVRTGPTGGRFTLLYLSPIKDDNFLVQSEIK